MWIQWSAANIIVMCLTSLAKPTALSTSDLKCGQLCLCTMTTQYLEIELFLLIPEAGPLASSGGKKRNNSFPVY